MKMIKRIINRLSLASELVEKFFDWKFDKNQFLSHEGK
ncbi:hypothetical protein A33Q_1888 [Indibacter alkaliphilus LW1]|uniref:Uncharacterized protein n=1 Tax=Indibacter alkaliphilus (strain CCUG 57479 / KCTC 22604 / LW1) TaxID=1189612 RepID=S2DIE3_INDAL|nr:hypothetical protein A33Q_1888 [Indibacter alkaliphilus LW1]